MWGWIREYGGKAAEKKMKKFVERRNVFGKRRWEITFVQMGRGMVAMIC